jgi:rubrerythrin
MSKIDFLQFVFVISAAGLIASCATEPPPLPPHNPANPQVQSSSKRPRNLLGQDETTLAIQRELSATEAEAKGAETMQHDMSKMPGMKHGQMQGMQHEGMKMEQHGQKKEGGEMAGHEGMQHPAAPQPEKKAVEAEMKKTSDEMKATSDAMKKKSDEMKTEAETTYTCPRHPQVQSDKPGKCPICGMTLVKKKGDQ